MRNKQLQDKMEEMLAVLRTQPDDMVVAHYTGLGLIEIASIWVSTSPTQMVWKRKGMPRWIALSSTSNSNRERAPKGPLISGVGLR